MVKGMVKGITYLASRELTFYDMLILSRHLGLDILLKSTENERTNDTVQPTDNFVILVAHTLNHIIHRIRKPVRELLPRSKDVRHQKV
jgi:hypothetical protein